MPGFPGGRRVPRSDAKEPAPAQAHPRLYAALPDYQTSPGGLNANDAVAAVDTDDLAGDVVCFLGGQVGGKVAELIGLGEAVQRYTLDALPQVLRGVQP